MKSKFASELHGPSVSEVLGSGRIARLLGMFERSSGAGWGQRDGKSIVRESKRGKQKNEEDTGHFQ